MGVKLVPVLSQKDIWRQYWSFCERLHKNDGDSHDVSKFKQNSLLNFEILSLHWINIIVCFWVFQCMGVDGQIAYYVMVFSFHYFNVLELINNCANFQENSITIYFQWNHLKSNINCIFSVWIFDRNLLSLFPSRHTHIYSHLATTKKEFNVSVNATITNKITSQCLWITTITTVSLYKTLLLKLQD